MRGSLTRDQARDALVRPHLHAVVLGAGLAVTGGALTAALEPREWVESLFGWLAVTGVVIGASGGSAIPLRRWRQRRWATMAARGRAPDWVTLVPRLQRVRRMGWLTLLAAWLIGAVGIRSAATVTERYEELAEHGVEVPGEVTRVEHPGRGIDSMRVAFVLDDVEHEVQIADIPDRFEVGDDVTVLVDPEDPEGATVKGVERSRFVDRAVQTFAIILSLILMPLGLLAIHRASMAGDALLATGLRPLEAWWKKGRYASHRLHRPGGDGRGIELGEVMVTNRWLSSTEGPVFVAGPERGPQVLTDAEGLVGTVRRPLLPPWDLRRLLS